MFLTACLLSVLPIQSQLQASELQTSTITVKLKSSTLRELFDVIESKSQYSFLIRNNDIDLNERVSIDMENKSIEEILVNALKNQKKIDYNQKDNSQAAQTTNTGANNHFFLSYIISVESVFVHTYLLSTSTSRKISFSE